MPDFESSKYVGAHLDHTTSGFGKTVATNLALSKRERSPNTQECEGTGYSTTQLYTINYITYYIIIYHT